MALQLHISGLNMWQMFVDGTILKKQEGILGSHCQVEFEQKSEFTTQLSLLGSLCFQIVEAEFLRSVGRRRIRFLSSPRSCSSLQDLTTWLEVFKIGDMFLGYKDLWEVTHLYMLSF